MRNHVVVVGFGTKGRVRWRPWQTTEPTRPRSWIIDSRPSSITDANVRGFAAIEGDATRREILRRAEIIKAREVIITLDRDDSAILVMLTVRQLNPSAHVVVAVREEDNASLLRQSGANSVVTSSEAVGRLLGLSAVSPNVGTVIEDLLSSKEGLEVGERQVSRDEVGKSPGEIQGIASSPSSATRPCVATTTRRWPRCRPAIRSSSSGTRNICAAPVARLALAAPRRAARPPLSAPHFSRPRRVGRFRVDWRHFLRERSGSRGIRRGARPVRAAPQRATTRLG